MATWHQQRNSAPLWHPTKWSVVEDPPGQCTTVSRFDTLAQAQTYLDSLKRHGNGRNAYLLPPPRMTGKSPCSKV